MMEGGSACRKGRAGPSPDDALTLADNPGTCAADGADGGLALSHARARPISTTARCGVRLSVPLRFFIGRPSFRLPKKTTAKLRDAVARRSWVLRGVNYAPASRRRRGPVALCPRLSPGLPFSLLAGRVKYRGGTSRSSSRWKTRMRHQQHGAPRPAFGIVLSVYGIVPQRCKRVTRCPSSSGGRTRTDDPRIMIPLL
jgi:hypothetical protein